MRWLLLLLTDWGPVWGEDSWRPKEHRVGGPDPSTVRGGGREAQLMHPFQNCQKCRQFRFSSTENWDKSFEFDSSHNQASYKHCKVLFNTVSVIKVTVCGESNLNSISRVQIKSNETEIILPELLCTSSEIKQAADIRWLYGKRDDDQIQKNQGTTLTVRRTL